MSKEEAFYGRSHPTHGQAVTPDTVHPAGMLYVGTGGNLDVTTVGGTRVTYLNVGGGRFFEVPIKQVHAAATTATDLIINYTKA